jgi:DNA mismatch endonuclease (patch repair protein)
MTVDALRSKIMRAVKAKDTEPELIVRRLLHRRGYRYRLHRRNLPGSPDLTFPAKRKVVFVHGCFWHGHDCKRGAREPKSNVAYWRAKIARNRERDREHQCALKRGGWAALTVWECELKDEDALLRRLQQFLERPAQ